MKDLRRFFSCAGIIHIRTGKLDVACLRACFAFATSCVARNWPEHPIFFSSCMRSLEYISSKGLNVAKKREIEQTTPAFFFALSCSCAF